MNITAAIERIERCEGVPMERVEMVTVEGINDMRVLIGFEAVNDEGHYYAWRPDGSLVSIEGSHEDAVKSLWRAVHERVVC